MRQQVQDFIVNNESVNKVKRYNKIKVDHIEFINKLIQNPKTRNLTVD